MTLIIAMSWSLLKAWSSEGTYTKSGLLLYCLSWLDLIAFKPYVILFYACKLHFDIVKDQYWVLEEQELMTVER